ncbi:MAG: hypothetical protein LBP74_00580, partial [Treponema sp.]|nr:hypothetical protein [Treponema sp.]
MEPLTPCAVLCYHVPMAEAFFDHPILNSPYGYPERHWELDAGGQMIQRVMPALMGLKNIMVINDEAHHCYREKGDDLTSLSNHPSDQSIRGGFSPDE